MTDNDTTPKPARAKPRKSVSKTPPKRLIVFADGTGNAFGGQASNIWRLYEAIEKSGETPGAPTQLARYIPGVGTSSIGLIRTIDGATGFGVPSNVLKLYRFLCWNWEPDCEIWMFGFSRGAFTVRTLAGLISSQGLIPAMRDGETVSSAEMSRNAKGAWRAYRADTAPLRDPKTGKLRMSWLVWGGRKIRDGLVWAKRKISGEAMHSEILDEMRTQEGAPRVGGNVKIRGLGLFDTVEAYGVPMEEIRRLIDFWLWPISFRNRVCSPIVQEVHHALSLDDERLTFHPLRFDQTPAMQPKDEAGNPVGPKINEVWFAGVHSDVGGGYPNDEAAHDPLVWMINAIGDNLEFQPSQVDGFRDARSKTSLLHDSRSGLSTTYRYAPRLVETKDEFGGKPVVHSSVTNRIRAGGTGYAPVTLTDDFALHDDPEGKLPVSYDAEIAEQAKALVMWRRVFNMAFIVLVVFSLLLPWTADSIRALFAPGKAPPGSVGGDAAQVGSAYLPGFLSWWLTAALKHPFLTSVPVVGAIALYLVNNNLRDKIKDTSRRAWGVIDLLQSKLGGPAPSRAVRMGERVLKMGWLDWVYRFITGKVIPGILVLLIGIAATIGVQKAGTIVTTKIWPICERPSIEYKLETGVSRVSKTQFSPASKCWASGFRLDEGATYWIKLEATVPFRDATLKSPVAGFTTTNLAHIVGSPWRRHSGHWFQPIAQIDPSGRAIVPLEEFTGRAPKFFPRPIEHSDVPRTDCAAPADTNTRVETFNAQFKAPATGHLYLYVNDVIFWYWSKFYRNNDGCAIVTIQKVGPPVPDRISAVSQ